MDLRSGLTRLVAELPQPRPTDLSQRLAFSLLAAFCAMGLLHCSTSPGNAMGNASGSPAATGTSASSGSGSGAPTGSGGAGGAVTATAVVSVESPTSALSGSSFAGSVTLNAMAPTGGANVALTSSNSLAATAPANITVAAGQTTGSFTVTTGNVSTDTSVSLTAAYNNTSASATITVKAPAPPPTPVTVSISPSTVSLTAGESQQFNASVTGSVNVAVMWNATGGTITNTGLFTAPSVSSTTTFTISATSQAAPSSVATAQVTVSPLPSPPGNPYSGTGAVASWKAYRYLDTDNLYHQAIQIYNAQGAYPVIGYSYSDSACTNLGDTFNDFWQPIGNGLWWFINRPDLIYVRWVWYDSAAGQHVLQQTPCIDYSGAPKYN